MNNQFDDTKFLKYTGLRWSGILKSIKKSSNQFQPIFEAFTNSLEAIRLRQEVGAQFTPYVKVVLNFSPSLIEGVPHELIDVSIEDNGVGFDRKNYTRLITFKDDTKGFNNRGSGRLQMIHYFRYVIFESVYMENDIKMKRKFILSCMKDFLDKNSILYEEFKDVPCDGDIKTLVRLLVPSDPKDTKYYQDIDVFEVKKALLDHYLLAFCVLKQHFPAIDIVQTIGGTETERISIGADEIPEPTHTDITVSVPLCKISDDMKRVESVEDEQVPIVLLPYRISADSLPESAIKVTSKDEISETTKVKLTCIAPSVSLGSYRYLFLLKSPYFNRLDSDERGNIEIIDRKEFKKRAKSQGYIEHQITLDDIEKAVNNKAKEIYEEISKYNTQFQERVEQLKRDYLLSEKALEDLSSCDGIDEVFKKAYTYDARVLAEQSTEYENCIQALNQLDPASEEYQNRLSRLTERFVEAIPIQNRVNLSKYVVRRKMVIELMGRILNRTLNCQNTSQRNVDEKLLHNLIFKQHSSNPLSSDLWLINEEYMYFRGSSESVLSKVEIDGKRIFKEEFAAEEEAYLTSLGENRKNMRTDVLLFPSEGKCVIIEFKNPNVNVATCLTQVSRYAYFLRNFCKPEFEFLTFYGYLIGEKLDQRDVRAADGDFKTSPNLDYLFRPAKTVVGEGEKQDGSLYMEVIQFSVLKERAELRNRAFMDQLMSEPDAKETKMGADIGFSLEDE